MRPVVITSPFSGANHFCNVFVTLLKQWYNCNGYVHSLITPESDKDVKIEYTDGIIKFTSNGIRRGESNSPDDPVRHNKWIANRKNGMQALLTSPNHLLKIYPFGNDILLNDSKSIRSFTNEFNYKIMYFERRDKLHQLLSDLSLSPTLPHTKEIKVFYDQRRAFDFIEMLENIKLIKSELPALTIYYEDFIKHGHNEDTVIELLSLDKKEYTPAVYKSYEFKQLTENNILNKQSWQSDRDEILARLTALG